MCAASGASGLVVCRVGPDGHSRANVQRHRVWAAIKAIISSSWYIIPTLLKVEALLFPFSERQGRDSSLDRALGIGSKYVVHHL